ncbi:PHP-associated domain-containing protein [Chloroflexota bacterium]
MTPHGEIFGIFLKESIPSGLSIEETISRIREQDGLVGAPHPFDTLVRVGLGEQIVEEIVEHIDFLEVFNARSPLLKASVQAKAFAQKYSIPQSAGSDAHSAYEIGYTFVEMLEFNGKEDFLQALSQGKIVARQASHLVHFASTWAKIKRKFKRW